MSAAIRQVPLPESTLLERYRMQDGHVDCYIAEVTDSISLPQLITAFYTSRAFRPERWLLGALLGKPADDSDLIHLAEGETDRFSAWSVEARCGDEILLCDFQAKTRSWLMVAPIAEGTRLHFGSAVVPAKSRTDRILFKTLLGFHRFYSRVLLSSAAKNLG